MLVQNIFTKKQDTICPLIDSERSNSEAVRGDVRGLARELAINTLAAVTLFGCSFGSYPTKGEIDAELPNVPPLETIAEGRSYIAVVRKEMVAQRIALQNLELALDAGIVGGLATVALGNALNWGAHARNRATIFTAAVIGVESTLSLKQQGLIINKGLDALLCVESQAEALYVAVKAVDAILAPVASDMRDLERALNELPPQLRADPMVRSAARDLIDAKNWLAAASVPTATVNAAVKIAVNQVIQVTVDQLSQTLPDGSAFAKISLSAQPATKSPTPATTPSPAARYNALYAPEQRVAPLAPPDPRIELVISFHTKLLSDWSAAEAKLPAAVTGASPAPLPVFTCGVAPLIPLAISPAAFTIGLDTGSTASAGIVGGVLPYTPQITVAANVGGLTPQNIDVTLSGTTVTLTARKPLGAGPYNLVVTDTTGAQRTATVTAGKPSR